MQSPRDEYTDDVDDHAMEHDRGARATVWGAVLVLFIPTLFAMLFFQDWLASKDWFVEWSDRLPHDPMLAALRIMDIAPVIVRCWIFFDFQYNNSGWAFYTRTVI